MNKLFFAALLLACGVAASAPGQRALTNSKPSTGEVSRGKAAPIEVLRDDVEELKGRMEAQDNEIKNLKAQIRSLTAKLQEVQQISSHTAEDARADLQ